MIETSATPKNAEHVARLLAFAREVLGVCDRVGIAPVLSGSPAVFAYAGDSGMEVHDIDLSCPESRFPQLQQALEAARIECRVKDWHVLQAHRGDLKVEFDATEHWMQGIPEDHETVRVGDVRFRAVGVDGLRELYLRGFVATAGKADVDSQRKQRACQEKLLILGTPGV